MRHKQKPVRCVTKREDKARRANMRRLRNRLDQLGADMGREYDLAPPDYSNDDAIMVELGRNFKGNYHERV